MMTQNKGKFFGSILIVIGTSVGGGMLALPMLSAATGFLRASILLLSLWALMATTALLVLKINLTLPKYKNSFSSMASTCLGWRGKLLASFSCMLLLYSLTAAYISGGASLLTNALNELHIQVPIWITAVLFVIILGGAIFWSTKATDHLNRGLISIKGFLLSMSLVFIAPHIDITLLFHSHAKSPTQYLWTAVPIFLCSFGFHTVIPSIRNYIGDKPQELKTIILSGTLVTFTIYLLWLAASLGTIPSASDHGSSVGEFINLLSIAANNKWIAFGINGFANIAITTSFLGVALGLFDFLADAFGRSDTRSGRLQTSLLTFIPPLFFALLYPKGFVIALGYAAIFVAILEIILPALMAYKLQIWKPTWLIIIFMIGITIISLQIMAGLHLLPTRG